MLIKGYVAGYAPGQCSRREGIMLKIGRYGIAFGGSFFWVQTQVPTRFWHFLCFWFTKEVNPNDVNLEQVDEKQQFLVGSEVEREGRLYRYWKASKDIESHAFVVEDQVIEEPLCAEEEKN